MDALKKDLVEELRKKIDAWFSDLKVPVEYGKYNAEYDFKAGYRSGMRDAMKFMTMLNEPGRAQKMQEKIDQAVEEFKNFDGVVTGGSVLDGNIRAFMK